MKNLLKKAMGKVTAVVAGSFAMVATASADVAALTTAITTKIGEAETFAYAILAVGLVAVIGIRLIKRFTKAGAS